MIDLRLGDCIEGMKAVSGVDLVVTSPPYNLSIEYGEHDDDMEIGRYYDWCREWLSGVYGMLKDGGRLCLNHYLSCGSAKLRFAPLMDLNGICQEIGLRYGMMRPFQRGLRGVHGYLLLRPM